MCSTEGGATRRKEGSSPMTPALPQALAQQERAAAPREGGVGPLQAPELAGPCALAAPLTPVLNQPLRTRAPAWHPQTRALGQDQTTMDPTTAHPSTRLVPWTQTQDQLPRTSACPGTRLSQRPNLQTSPETPGSRPPPLSQPPGHLPGNQAPSSSQC